MEKIPTTETSKNIKEQVPSGEKSHIYMRINIKIVY